MLEVSGSSWWDTLSERPFRDDVFPSDVPHSSTASSAAASRISDPTMSYVDIQANGSPTNVPYLRDRPLKGHFLLSEAGVRNVAPIPGIPIRVKLEYKRAYDAAGSSSNSRGNQQRDSFRNLLKERRTDRETWWCLHSPSVGFSSSSTCSSLLLFQSWVTPMWTCWRWVRRTFSAYGDFWWWQCSDSFIYGP